MKKLELEPDLANCELAQHPESLAIVTTTFYKKWFDGDPDITNTDKTRGDIAFLTIQKATNLGHQVVVVDGSPVDSPFYQAIRKIPGIKVFDEDAEHRGMDPSRQYGFELASQLEGVKAILWTEPEKEDLIRPECLWPAVLAILRDQYDLVIPARDDAGFATYPDYQVAYEKRANGFFNRILKIITKPKGFLEFITRKLRKGDIPSLDAWFGPRVFKPEHLSYFSGKYEFAGMPKEESVDTESDPPAVPAMHMHVKTNKYNSATFIPILKLAHDGKRIGSVTVPYRHPKIQTDNEKDNLDMQLKRHDQLMNIITASLHYARYLLNKKSRLSIH